MPLTFILIPAANITDNLLEDTEGGASLHQEQPYSESEHGDVNEDEGDCNRLLRLQPPATSDSLDPPASDQCVPVGESESVGALAMPERKLSSSGGNEGGRGERHGCRGGSDEGEEGVKRGAAKLASRSSDGTREGGQDSPHDSPRSTSILVST